MTEEQISSRSIGDFEDRTHQTQFSVHGEGLPLVCLPALFAGEWIWDDSRIFLQDQYQIITPKDAYAKLDIRLASAEGLINYTKKFLAALSLTEVVLVGNSLGGLVAMGAAVDMPEVKAVIISGAPATTGSEMTLPPINRSLTEQMKRMIGENLFYNQQFLKDSRIVASATDLAQDRNAVRFIIRSLSSVNHYNINALLEQLSSPLFFIWGQEDVVSPFSKWRDKLGMDLPINRVALIPECGHSPMIERPKEYAAHLHRFLKQIGY